MIVTKPRNDVRFTSQRLAKVGLFLTLSVGAAGCVNVAAPDKPIEINLNINIRQEVLVKLQRDVEDLIKKNPGVF